MCLVDLHKVKKTKPKTKPRPTPKRAAWSSAIRRHCALRRSTSGHSIPELWRMKAGLESWRHDLARPLAKHKKPDSLCVGLQQD